MAGSFLSAKQERWVICLNQPIQDLLDRYKGDAISLRRKLHQSPELSMQETNTTRVIRETLEQYGIRCMEDYSLPTGAAAILEGKEPGKTHLLRADIDALPMEEKSALPFASQHSGVCHSCGHDIHTSALLLCARILSTLEQPRRGRVILLFQPAEETGQGSKAVIDSGLLERYPPDLVLGAHCWPDLPAGSVGLRVGSFMAASDTLHIRVKGKGGHGAHPHKSIDPVVTAAYIITQLQSIVSRSIDPLESVVITIGTLSAGTVTNVIPDEVQMGGTVRIANGHMQPLVEERIRTICHSCAQAMGAECEVNYVHGMPALDCDAQAVSILERAAKAQLGEKRVAFLSRPSMGSEDFARYLTLAPGAMFRIGTANQSDQSRLPLHNAHIIFDEESCK